jgi:hypothetical protein
LKKYYDYGRDFIHYQEANEVEARTQLGVFRSVYVRNWRKFLKQPLFGGGFILYNLAKYTAGGTGFLVGKLRKHETKSR